VSLAFFLGRPLTPAEFPEGLPQAIDEATEVAADGAPIPLREELRSWIRKMVCLDRGASFRSLLEGQKALEQLLQDGAAYPASSSALQAFVERCESAPWYQHTPEPETPPRESEHDVPAAPPAANPADLVAAAPEPGPTSLETGPLEDADAWAPTPEPDVRTLFEAPAAPPPPQEPPPMAAPPPPVESRFHGDLGHRVGPHGANANQAPLDVPGQVTGRTMSVRAEPSPEPWRPIEGPDPPAVAQAPVRQVRRESIAVPAAKRPGNRAPRFTPCILPAADARRSLLCTRIA